MLLLSVEGRGRDGHVCAGEGLQTLLAVLVPEIGCAVGSHREEGAPHLVETNAVHRVDVVVVAVTLEREILLRITVLDKVNGAATLDAAHGEARAVGEGCNRARLVFERRLRCLRTAHTHQRGYRKKQTNKHPNKRTQYLLPHNKYSEKTRATRANINNKQQYLVRHRRILQIIHQHVPLRRTHHKQRRARVHCIHALRQRHRTNRVGRSRIPVLERFVPRAGYDQIESVQKCDFFDRAWCCEEMRRRTEMIWQSTAAI